MKEQCLDHLLLSGFDSIRWVTNVRADFTRDSSLDWFAALVDPDGGTVLFSQDISETDSSPVQDLPWIKRRVPTPSWQSLWVHASVYSRLLVDELQAAGAKRLGVDFLHFSIRDEVLRAMPDLEIVPIAYELLEIRKTKVAGEVRLLEAACDVGSLSVAAALKRVEEGMTDHDVLGLAAKEAYRHGVEAVSHTLVVARGSGYHDFYAHGQRLWDGDTFILDFGVYGIGGYCHDFCRTHFLGEPPAHVLTAYRGLLKAFQDGVEFAKPGVRCSQIAERINSGLRKQGLLATPYALGHGIGVRLIELPSIHRVEFTEKDDILEEGMVICLEPTTFVEDRGHLVKLKEEDQFLVEHSALRQLTKTKRAV